VPRSAARDVPISLVQSAPQRLPRVSSSRPYTHGSGAGSHPPPPSRSGGGPPPSSSLGRRLARERRLAFAYVRHGSGFVPCTGLPGPPLRRLAQAQHFQAHVTRVDEPYRCWMTLCLLLPHMRSRGNPGHRHDDCPGCSRPAIAGLPCLLHSSRPGRRGSRWLLILLSGIGRCGGRTDRAALLQLRLDLHLLAERGGNGFAGRSSSVGPSRRS